MKKKKESLNWVIIRPKTEGSVAIPGRKCQIQAYLSDIAGWIPDLCNKTSPNLFDGKGSCLQFVNYATSVKRNEAKHNERRSTCAIWYRCFLGSQWICAHVLRATDPDQCLWGPGQYQMATWYKELRTISQDLDSNRKHVAEHFCVRFSSLPFHLPVMRNQGNLTCKWEMPPGTKLVWPPEGGKESTKFWGMPALAAHKPINGKELTTTCGSKETVMSNNT